jgi:hypothetical protein
MNAPALAKKLSSFVRKMLKGSDAVVGTPFKAQSVGVFKNRPPSWNFIIRTGAHGATTFVYVQQKPHGLDVHVDGPDAALVRDIIAEAT